MSDHLERKPGNLKSGLEPVEDGSGAISMAAATRLLDKATGTTTTPGTVGGSGRLETGVDASYWRERALEDLAAMPDWHSAACDDDVAAARRDLSAALEAAAGAREALMHVDAQERTETAQEAARVRSAAAQGQAVKPKPAPDFEAMRRHLAAVLAGRLDAARRARGRYDQIFTQRLPAVAEKLEASMSERHQAAKAAHDAAVAAWDGLLATYSAAVEARRAIDPGGEAVGLASQVARAGEAYDVVARALDDDRLAGRTPLHHPKIEPPMSWRQGVAESMRYAVGPTAEWKMLSEVERREEFKYTRYTFGWNNSLD